MATTSQPYDASDADVALFRVLRDDGSASPGGPSLSPETLLRAYRAMRLMRVLDARMLMLQRQGRIGFYGTCTGQEATPVAAGLVLRPSDWIYQALREHPAMLVRGFPLEKLVAQCFGNARDPAKGRQMPSHPSGREVNQVTWSPCIGSQLPHAVGTAWAMKLRKKDDVVMAFAGEGATSQGDFHAAMNFAAVYAAPCVIVCQNNQFAISVPAARQSASVTFAIKARAYGMPGVRVDGNDLLAVYRVLEDAVLRARSGGGPTFVEAVTYRMGPHSSSDDPSRYRTLDEVDLWATRDPIVRLRRHLVREALVRDGDDEALDRALDAEVKAAIAAVEGAPPPSVASLFDDVYAEPPWHLREQRLALQALDAHVDEGREP